MSKEIDVGPTGYNFNIDGVEYSVLLVDGVLNIQKKESPNSCWEKIEEVHVLDSEVDESRGRKRLDEIRKKLKESW